MSADQLPAAAQHVLAARARRLAAPPAAAPTGAVELLEFSVANLRVAAPAERVRSVLPPGPVAGLPAGGHALTGLRAIRGAVVALADLGALLGSEADPGPPANRFAIVLDHVRAPLALLADQVHGVVTTSQVDAASETALLCGFTREGTAVLDVDALLTDPRLSTDQPDG